MYKVYIFESGNVKIAVKSSESIEKFTDFLVSVFDWEPYHLYYYSDEKEKKVLFCKEFEEEFLKDLKSISLSTLVSRHFDQLRVKKAFNFALMEGLISKLKISVNLYCGLNNEEIIKDLQNLYEILMELNEGLLEFLRKEHFRIISPKDRVRNLVDFIGSRIKLTYDLGEMNEIFLKLSEILTSKNFKAIYGNRKLPTVI